MKRFQKISFYLMQIIFICMMSIILILNFFFNDIEYACKRAYPNKEIFGWILLLFFLICFLYFAGKYIYRKFGGTDKAKRLPNLDRVAVIVAILLFFVQMYIAYNIYFLTGWDVAGEIIPGAKLLADGDISGFSTQFWEYFSRYPNNIPMIVFYGVLLNLNAKIGIWRTQNELMSIITVNCALNAITCFLTYKITKTLLGKKASIAGFMIVVILIGISPWSVITYSDSLALAFPSMILALYIKKIERPLYKWMKYMAILGLGYLGYCVKPQTLIVVIAIVVVEVIRRLSLANKRMLGRWMLIILASFICLGAFKTAADYVFTIHGFERDENRTLDMTHFFMMGQNPDTKGVWSAEDINFSLAHPNTWERHKATIKKGLTRIWDMGFPGYLEFLGEKTLTAYNDGTFAWGCEGEFWKEIYEPKNEVASPLLREIFYQGGKYYNFWTFGVQGLWLAVLLLVVCNFICRKNVLNKLNDPILLVMMLSLEGLTLFQLLFEVRARYLYTYVPFFIILAVMGMKHVVHIVEKIVTDRWRSI